jgi:hypothetical protein
MAGGAEVNAIFNRPSVFESKIRIEPEDRLPPPLKYAQLLK